MRSPAQAKKVPGRWSARRESSASVRIWAFKAARVLACFDRTALDALLTRTHGCGVTAAEMNNYRADNQQKESPPQVYVEAQRTRVNRLVTQDAKACKECSNNHEQKANRKANIQTHIDYQKMRFRAKETSNTMKPTVAGCRYQRGSE